MKFSILIDMLFDLLALRSVTATYLSEKYNISPRTVYRYVDILAEKIPLHIKRGRNGGISLSDSYLLPVNFMNAEEYDAAIEALCLAYARTPDERFLKARRKLSSQKKWEKRELLFNESAENVFIDGGTSGVDTVGKRLRVLQECIRECAVAEIVYVAENGEKSEDKIEPHTLILQDNIWGMYAFSHKLRSFYPYAVGRIYSIQKTEETFRKRPFDYTEVTSSPCETATVQLECKEDALPSLIEWLGVENLRSKNGVHRFDVTLPKCGLIEKLLSYGASVKVLSPASLQTALLKVSENIKALYV